MLPGVFFTLLVLIAFVFIYLKYKTEEEELLILKLIGYYLLGSFRFNINEIALPVGFIVFLVFFRPQVNKSLKRSIAFLGLFAFVCGVLIPFAQTSYFERKREVKALSTNVYNIDLNSEHSLIKKTLGIDQDTKIEDFNLDFESSGEITGLRYSFITQKDNGFVVYHVTYYPSYNEDNFIVRPSKVRECPQYVRLIDDNQFFPIVGKLNIKQAKPNKDYSSYGIYSSGEHTDWFVEDWDNFLITGGGFKELKDKELPISGYVFQISGIKEISKTVSESENGTAYILQE